MRPSDKRGSSIKPGIDLRRPFTPNGVHFGFFKIDLGEIGFLVVLSVRRSSTDARRANNLRDLYCNNTRSKQKFLVNRTSILLTSNPRAESARYELRVPNTNNNKISNKSIRSLFRINIFEIELQKIKINAYKFGSPCIKTSV